MPLDKKLYDQISSKDSIIADFCKDLLAKKDKMDGNDILALFNKAIDESDPKITASEAEALRLIVDAKIIDADGMKVLHSIMLSNTASDVFVKGGKVLTKDDDIFSLVMTTIGTAPSFIDFQSPGTRLTYSAMTFQVVRTLIQYNQIKLILLQDSNLLSDIINLGAIYDARTNFMILSGAIKTQPENIVHESAHAIQDWNDIAGVKRDYTESDAYICGALYYIRKLGKTLPSKWQPVANAVDFIVNNPGKAVIGNAKWEKVYMAVADFYEPIRKAQQETELLNFTDEEGNLKKSEKQLYGDVVNVLSKKTAAPKAGGGASKP